LRSSLPQFLESSVSREEFWLTKLFSMLNFKGVGVTPIQVMLLFFLQKNDGSSLLKSVED